MADLSEGVSITDVTLIIGPTEDVNISAMIIILSAERHDDIPEILLRYPIIGKKETNFFDVSKRSVVAIKEFIRSKNLGVVTYDNIKGISVCDVCSEKNKLFPSKNDWLPEPVDEWEQPQLESSTTWLPDREDNKKLRLISEARSYQSIFLLYANQTKIYNAAIGFTSPYGGFDQDCINLLTDVLARDEDDTPNNIPPVKFDIICLGEEFSPDPISYFLMFRDSLPLLKYHSKHSIKKTILENHFDNCEKFAAYFAGHDPNNTVVSITTKSDQSSRDQMIGIFDGLPFDVKGNAFPVTITRVKLVPTRAPGDFF